MKSGYNAAFVSGAVRHETKETDGKPVKRNSQTICDHDFTPVKWWEDPDVKDMFSSWGVSKVTPPAANDLRESRMGGPPKYGPVTLHILSDGTSSREAQVAKHMDEYNKLTGVFQAYKVKLIHESGPVRSSEAQQIDTMFHADEAHTAPKDLKRRPSKSGEIVIPSEAQQIDTMFHTDEADEAPKRRPSKAEVIVIPSEAQQIDTMFHTDEADTPPKRRPSKSEDIVVPSQAQQIDTMFHTDEPDTPPKRRPSKAEVIIKPSEAQQIDTMFHADDADTRVPSKNSVRSNTTYGSPNQTYEAAKSSEMQSIDNMFHAVEEDTRAPSK
jgi:hypothetical protein